MFNLLTAVNLSERWDVSMAIREDNPQTLWFSQMLLVQRYNYIFLSLLTVYFCFRISRHSLMHFNFRIILCVGSLFGIIFTGARILMYTLLTMTPDLTDRTFCNIFCMLLGSINSLSLTSLLILLFFGAVERHLATILVEKYESKNRSVGYILISISLIISFCMAVFVNLSRLYSQFDLKTTYQTCIIVEVYPIFGLVSFVIGFICCFLSAMWQYYLYKRNCLVLKRGTGVDSLAIRFQISENVKTTLLIFLILIGYMGICIIGMIISSKRYHLTINGDLLTAKLLMQLSYMTIDTFIMLFMVFILVFHPGLRFSVKCDILRLFGQNITTHPRYHRRHIGIRDDAKAYFDQLDAAWR